MSKSFVDNLTGRMVILPAPYQGWIEGFASVCIGDTPAVTTANLGALVGPTLAVRTAWDEHPTDIPGVGVNGGPFVKVFTVPAPAAASLASVHAAYSASGANAFPGPITNPDTPRNGQVNFSAGWDGGNVTLNGTTQFDEAVSEVFGSSPGATVVGSKIFKTVPSIVKTAVGTTGTASVGVGNKLGVPSRIQNGAAVLFVDNAAEPATLDATLSAFTPTGTVPDGSANYALTANFLGGQL